MADNPILAGLDPGFRATLEQLMARARVEHLDPVPTFGLRDPWTQARLWRRSRSRDQVDAKIALFRGRGAPYLAQILEDVGPQPRDQWATDAAPGLSWHQWGEACDFGWRSPRTGRVLQGDREGDGDEFDYAEACYRKLGVLCGDFGLTWGGGWSDPDENHVQRPSASSPLRALTYPQIDAKIRERWPRRP